MVWRGPMVTQALQTLERYVLERRGLPDRGYAAGNRRHPINACAEGAGYGRCDRYTPNDIALLDARKGLKMFEKVGIPIFEIIANMSFHICSKCGHEEHIFGEGGGQKMCKDYDVELLGICRSNSNSRAYRRRRSDRGGRSERRIAEIYREIARRLAVKVDELSLDHSALFAKIVIENTYHFPAENAVVLFLAHNLVRFFHPFKMTIKSDRWIRGMAVEHRIIGTFEPNEIRYANGHKIVSYGTSSYGLTISAARMNSSCSRISIPPSSIPRISTPILSST